MAGETLAATGSLLGHSSPKSTERYAHTADEVLLKASAVVAGRLIEQGSDQTAHKSQRHYGERLREIRRVFSLL
jgi:hypothetical protein